MSLRLDMLRAAARTRRHRPEGADRVARFLRSQVLPEGGFPDRAGRADLYYTVFGMLGLAALGEQPEATGPALAARTAGPLPGRLIAYLRDFGDGADLDFVHLACLVRCWSMLPDHAPPPQVRRAMLACLETHRAADGGYAPAPGAEAGTAYAAFLALGAYEDFGAPVPEPGALVRAVRSLRAADGGFANTPGAATGSTPATAAAVVLLANLGHPVDAVTARWLLGQMGPEGGWRAAPAAPVPDLLSTATALHALAAAGAPLDSIRASCLAFVESLASERGGFRGHAADDLADCEYTFYGLLALGHLAT